MNTSHSTVLQDYYARERETLKTEPTVRDELRRLGVTGIQADYDGVGDSGQIENISYLDGSNPPTPVTVSDATNQRVEALLYALLELRHGGWENNDGAFGSFRWNLDDGTIEHEHNLRYTEHETSVHEGFTDGTGDVS